ncbi:VOC family protein [Maricaulis sp.]|uniref:VOC family protein n=1 Tax=Maricaulis sp. TaxID=1486257 RepID=UPI002614235B|nr:VOC family protein [Maricaulis sp.]
MTQMIFVNLPVRNLDRSIAFYEAIGAVKDSRFCDGTAAMMRFSEAINVMLLTHARFADFTDRTIVDATTHAQVLNCLSRESRADVDATVDRAGKAGGRIDPGPKQDLGFMYGRSCADPDGHIWELAWMDVEAALQGTPDTADA